MCYLRLGELVSSDLYPRLLRVLKEDYPEITREQGLPDKFLQPVGAVSEFITEFRSEEHTSELQSPCNLVCRLLLEKKKKTQNIPYLNFSNLSSWNRPSKHDNTNVNNFHFSYFIP